MLSVTRYASITKKSGIDFLNITLDEAIKLIAEKLNKIKDQPSKPRAVKKTAKNVVSKKSEFDHSNQILLNKSYGAKHLFTPCMSQANEEWAFELLHIRS